MCTSSSICSEKRDRYGLRTPSISNRRLPAVSALGGHQPDLVGRAPDQDVAFGVVMHQFRAGGGLDAVTKLGEENAATKAVVARYFGTDLMTTGQMKTTIDTLRQGYQKIANACNSSAVIISDEPGDRNGTGWEDWAFIYTTEAMRVIYLQNAWLKKAGQSTPSNASPLFRCARTVVHELSHKELSTEDVVYGPKGLKVQGSNALTADYALHNADSWAYFSMDVTGNLTGPDAVNGATACSAIRAVPARTLTTA